MTIAPNVVEIFGRDIDAADPLTEAGAAERFARLHGDDLRYDHRRQRWLLWSGHRWTPDADAEVTRVALDFARSWQREALEIVDTKAREATVKLAITLERRDKLASLLAFAKDLKPIADAGDRWDADPWLLGVPNGVVDLRTATLRPGRREDRITMSAGVRYDPDATCPRWERFITEVFADPDLAGFAHRAAGYSVTGDTSEQCLMMLHGTGANGKGSYTNMLAEVLGDYAWNMPFSTIEMRDRAAIPNDLAALAGRRFIVASETNDGTRLNESRVKALTGCDPITARFLHAEFFTFRPVAKFWLCVNHKPIVRDDSYGFWRRLRLVPFTQTFTVNATLSEDLRAEAPGILAWAVRGCVAWQAHGLTPPAVVIGATAEYERDSDPFGDFITDAIDFDANAEVGASDLFEHYREWATRQGMGDRERMTSTMFGRKAAERFTRAPRRSGKVYLGIARRAL